MRLFIVSVLAALSNVHGAAVGYPYRSDLLSYSPARGEFPVQNGLVNGYIRYIDAAGAERLVPYQYPEPLFAVRRLSYSTEDKPAVLLRSGFIGTKQQENQQELEANFRAWCEQRYNALRAEIDQLRLAGQKPSTDIMEQLKPLETVLRIDSFDASYESPEIKRTREEQLRLWNEARLQVEAEEQRLRAKQTEFQQASSTQLKTSATQTAETPLGETEEQKRAREEHLRLYQEQLQQIEAQRVRLQAAEIKPGQNTQTFTTYDSKTQLTNEGLQGLKETQTKTIVKSTESSAQLSETPEVLRATEEHLRLWNEAKLRAEQASTKLQTDSSISNLKTTLTNEALYQQNGQLDPQRLHTEIGLRSDFALPQTVQETPEVVRAREEHLRLVNEAKLRAEAAGTFKPTDDGYYKQETQLQQQQQIFQETASTLKNTYPAESNQQAPQQIADTPEVIRAREEHLRLVNEANLRAQAEATYKPTDDGSYKQEIQQQQQIYQQTAPALKNTFVAESNQQGPQQIADTPEVMRAREEHLRLVNKLRAQAEGTYKPTDDGFYKQETQLQQQQQQQIYKETAPALKNTYVAESNQQATQQIADSPEVIRAREEHLRLVNEAKLRAQAEGTYKPTDDGFYKQETQLQQQQQQQIYQDTAATLKNTYAAESTQQGPQQIADTPEVIRAREEHLRLVNEAKLRVQAAEQYKTSETGAYNPDIQQRIDGIFLKSEPGVQQPIAPPQPIADTPEVIRAREEHLRIFNEAQRLAVQQQQIETSKLQQTEQGLKAYTATENKAEFGIMTEKERLLEAERLREAERLMTEERLREERLLEAERLREAERLKLEAKLREDELQREMLRLREEERFQEVERLRLEAEEAKRLSTDATQSFDKINLKTQQQTAQQVQTFAPATQQTQSYGQIKTTVAATLPVAAILPATSQTQGFILKNQYQSNPFLLRIASPANNAFGSGFNSLGLTEQKPATTFVSSEQNPFLIRYTDGSIKTSSSNTASGTAFAASQSSFQQGTAQQTNLKSEIKPISQQNYEQQSLSTAGNIEGNTFSSSLKFNYGDATDVAALEKATREHFRAHEIALEQLRLAKLRNPYDKDCN